MGLTNPGGVGATAAHLLQGLAHVASRVLRSQLDAVLDLVLRRPRPTAASAGSGPASPEPGAAGSPARPGRGAAGRDAAVPDAPGPELPRAYGQSRAVLVAQDAWSLFAYWEVSPVRRVEALRALGTEGEEAREILRVLETTRIPATGYDIELAPGAERAYLRVEHPGRTYRVEIGLWTPSGRFVPLATSNLASTPEATPSDDTTVRWVSPGPEGPPRELVAEWSGQRVVTPRTATVLGGAAGPSAPGDAAPDAGSSAALPAGPRASDALPLR